MGATQRPCLLVLPNCTESLTIGTLTTEPRLSLAYLEVTLSTEIWWVGLLEGLRKDVRPEQARGNTHRLFRS